jgi:hypothetical protein
MCVAFPAKKVRSIARLAALAAHAPKSSTHHLGSGKTWSSERSDRFQKDFRYEVVSVVSRLSIGLKTFRRCARAIDGCCSISVEPLRLATKSRSVLGLKTCSCGSS